MRVADYVVDFLYKKGVNDIFLVTGGGAMFLNDALALHGKMNFVCCHHEQAVAMAADAYSRISGNLGAGMVTSGPGCTNALTGVLSAWQDSTPCIFVSGQSKRKETIQASKIKGLRQFGILEADFIPMVSPITKYAVMVDDPTKIRYYMEKAAYLAKNGRPGPVWIDIPQDVQGMPIEPSELEGFPIPSTIPFQIEEKVMQAAKMIANAKRPAIIAGNGVRISKAISALRKLAERMGIPIATSYLGIDLFEEEYPYYIGRVGSKGQRAANFTIQNSDLLIIIGTSLSVSLIGHEYGLFAPKAKKIVVDIEPVEMQKKTILIDLFIRSDAREFLEALCGGCKLRSSDKIAFPSSWLEACRSWKSRYPTTLPFYSHDEPINTYYLVDEISKKSDRGDTIICDAGSIFYIGAQAIKMKKNQRYITPGSVGTMGYNLPASVGASIATGKGRVICITGDGSFQMNIQELQTIVHNNLPIKIFVLNNNGYLSIRGAQIRYFNRLIGESANTGMSCPDTEKIASAYGIKFFKVSKPSELPSVIDAVLSSSGPTICEVISRTDQEIAPVVSAEKREDGSMVSKSLDDMYPFLDKATYEKETHFKNDD